jgi:hypothetical protein
MRTDLSLPLLLDALKGQMQEDRKEQDTLLVNLESIKKKVGWIRRRQDSCWELIKKALAREEEHVDEDAISSQESQTKVWAFGVDNDGFMPISEAADSVLGRMSQDGDKNVAGVEGRRDRIHEDLSMTVRRAETERERSRRERTPTAIHIDRSLGAVNELIPDDGTENHSTRETVSASRMPTPVTPGQQRRALQINLPSTGVEMRGLTKNTSDTASLVDIPAQPRTLKPLKTSMKAPPTPTSKSTGKRKRAEKDWEPTMSSNRLSRRAKTSAIKRNTGYYDFAHMSSREQSLALADESRNPFFNCGGCRMSTCQHCKQRKEQAEYYMSALRTEKETS